MLHTLIISYGILQLQLFKQMNCLVKYVHIYICFKTKYS